MRQKKKTATDRRHFPFHPNQNRAVRNQESTLIKKATSRVPEKDVHTALEMLFSDRPIYLRAP